MAPELIFALALSQSGSLALSRALSQLLQFHSERLKRDQVWLYMYTNPHDWLYTNPHDCMGLMQPLNKNRTPKIPHAIPRDRTDRAHASESSSEREHRNHTSLSATLPSRPPMPPAPTFPPMSLVDAHRIRGTCRKSMVHAMTSIMSCPPWAPCAPACWTRSGVCDGDWRIQFWR